VNFNTAFALVNCVLCTCYSVSA